jgi:hypothetical protein
LLLRGAREFVLIVAGVMVALFADGMMEERAERQLLSGYLEDVRAEIEANDYTIANLGSNLIPRKLRSLERINAFLSDPNGPVSDTAALFGNLAQSAATIRPWLTTDRYTALRSSGSLRLLRDANLAAALANFYEEPTVLFGQAEDSRGRYMEIVNEVIPFELADDLNRARSYASRREDPDSIPIPGLGAAPDYERALVELRSRVDDLRRHIGSEAAYAAAYLYSFARYTGDQELLLGWLDDHEDGAG